MHRLSGISEYSTTVISLRLFRSSQRITPTHSGWAQLLTVIGFCFSLGWNFFFFRICYELIPLFRSMRVVTRGSVLAYLGLGILAGLGVRRLLNGQACVIRRCTKEEYSQ
jgi:hypothetical protein